MLSFSGKAFGYPQPLFKRHLLFFLAIQLAIWAKVALFSLVFGKSVLSFAPLLPPLMIAAFFKALGQGGLFLFDFLFHETAHALIALAVFLFALRATKLPWLQTLALAVWGAVLHNVGYWLTGVFHSQAVLVEDFALDIVFLLFFMVVFHLLGRVIRDQVPLVPFLEK